MTNLLDPLFVTVAHHKGSDLHVKSDAVPKIRVRGNLTPVSTGALDAATVEASVLATMDAKTRARFEETSDADYAYSAPNPDPDGEPFRFRVNAFRANGEVGLIARLVADQPASLADLNLPDVLSTLALQRQGMCLVTGPTGSGKSTTLAAMVDLINATKPVHILTIEDPVEILHRDKVASINQRELRRDTNDFASALTAAMRQDPDVILIGEMRDTHTVRAAVAAAQTGHFVLSTLHTTDAAETINRIIDFFPAEEQTQIRLALAQSLQGVVCQRLAPTVDGGRVAAMEILVRTKRVEEAIADPSKTSTITEIVKEGGLYGMRTFDQHLVALVLEGTISIETAKDMASKRHNLIIELKRAGVRAELADD